MPLCKKGSSLTRPPLMVLLMGAANTGKTTAALSFPSPLVLDGESGTRHYRQEFDGAVIETKRFGEAVRVVRELRAGGKVSWKEGAETLSFQPRTLVLDPFSAFWDAIQAAKLTDAMAAQGVTVSAGTERPKTEKDSMQAWGAIKLHWRSLLSDLQASGVNVVATAHEKEEVKVERGQFGVEVVKTGRIVAELEKGYAYAFDLVLHLQFVGGRRVATVLKSRLKTAEGKDRFEMGQKLDRWDFEALAGTLAAPVAAPAAPHETEAEALEADRRTTEKDPVTVKLAHEIRAVLLPKRGISNEDAEAYLLQKTDAAGAPLATAGTDGKLHLSDLAAKHLRWFKSILEDDTNAMKLIAKIGELKKAGAK